MKVTHAGIAVALAVAVVAVIFVFPGLNPFPTAPALSGEATSSTTEMATATDTTQTYSSQPMNDSNPQDATSLVTTDEVVGTGATAQSGDTVTVKYVGTFTNGTVFDASANHPETANGFTFRLGVDSVIQGWQQGLVGMKVGGKRKLVIPPSLGYGPNDYGPIPGNSTLIFEVELINVQKGQ